MAEALEHIRVQIDLEDGKGEKRMQEIFQDGWNKFDELQNTSLPFNSTEFQSKVKEIMKIFETVTILVSKVGMFSANEQIDEVSTESLQFMLLPYFLGKLALNINQTDRTEVLNVAEVYFKDHLRRCVDYELCEAPKETVEKVEQGNNANELAQLMRDAHARNDKIAQFREKKELEAQLQLMKEAVKNNTAQEEQIREYFLKFLKKSIIDTKEELTSLELEKQMAQMRNISSSPQKKQNTQGHHVHHHNAPKPKPLQPFIITRDATQKAVFGLGYPSLPIMTVSDFYNQRVQEGIFPDKEKMEKMNEAKAIANARNPEDVEEEEKAAKEEQVEADDEEYLARMRQMDEYKDVVRRGDGNRYNRS